METGSAKNRSRSSFSHRLRVWRSSVVVRSPRQFGHLYDSSVPTSLLNVWSSRVPSHRWCTQKSQLSHGRMGAPRMREVLAAHQGAIKGPSRAIKGPSRAIRGHQGPSGAIRDHQGPSRAIKGHQVPSRAYLSHWSISVSSAR